MADLQDTLTEMERLLLIAAAICDLGPNTDLGVANTYKVVRQALEWSGQRSYTQRNYILDSTDPIVAAVYAPLVRMTHHVYHGRPPERPGPSLFEGAGNWGIPGKADEPPCDPNYNSCRLTDLGSDTARRLLDQHPEFAKESE